ncbi:MAG TPA: hypothetical protein VHY22_10960 [Chthoniobacteraceae bacterium]|jgi:hypothetical protein|nr:hypothetical protein [Chthoniobacteraceae bacterium]
MKSFTFGARAFLAISVLLLTWSTAYCSETLDVYAAKATMGGVLQTSKGAYATLTPWHLNTKEFVDLALGNPLNTPLAPGVTLAVAANYTGVESGSATSTKQVVIVDTVTSSLLATVIVSDTASVCNAQTTYHTFKRLAFGGGNVLSTGNVVGGRVQMVGVLLRKITNLGVTPITSLSMVGSIDLLVDGANLETFYVTHGVVTASGEPIGTITNNN